MEVHVALVREVHLVDLLNAENRCRSGFGSSIDLRWSRIWDDATTAPKCKPGLKMPIAVSSYEKLSCFKKG